MTTTNFPNGVTNALLTSVLSSYVALDPSKIHQYFEDFDYYTAADWTITNTGVSVIALADADGGNLSIATAGADDDASFFNKVGESFLFETGKKIWFKTRFKISDATQSDLVVGLQITDTTPLDVTDGVFFRKDDGDTNVDFVVEKDNTATTSTAITTLSDDTFITLGFCYDGVSKILFFVDDVQLGSSVTTNLPDDEVLTISFGVQAGEAAAKTLTMDYVFAAKER